MTLIRRRLFWKLYLTLLASLVAVVLFMGCFWWLLGETQGERWGAAPIHLAGPDTGDGEDPRKTGGADVSLYGGDGRLISTHGRPIAPLTNSAAAGWQRWNVVQVELPDGRTLLTRLRPPVQPGFRILAVMIAVVGGVGLAAFPLTARLTRRLEALRAGMARWGDGDRAIRVDERGSDEVAVVARTFNVAAGRIDALLSSQKALLANASHELRSPLARLRLAIDLWSPEATGAPHAEIVRNLAEIDQLVDEILLSSRLDAAATPRELTGRVDLLGLAAEEAVPFGAIVSGEVVEIDGEERLLRRLLRNLLENGVRHGRPPVEIMVSQQGSDAVVAVSDRGPGIAPAERERVFEPFYRPAGHGEAGGGWGLGLALVRQIAERHGGRVDCEAGPAGGSRFVVRLKGG